MTEQQPTRDQLRALANEATPGPWEVRGDELTGTGVAHCCMPPDREDRADMDFIAAARTAVPQLLDQLDQAEARLKAVRDLHRPYGDTLTGLYICTACDQPCPCPTTRALESVPTPRV